VPGAVHTWAYGINTSGQLVGSYTDASRSLGFLFDQGSYTTLDVPGSTSTSAYGINDSGVVAGTFGTTQGAFCGGVLTIIDVVRGFLLNGATYNPVSFDKATDTAVLGINVSGEIVGTYAFIDLFRCTTTFQGSFYDIYAIGVPGATYTEARGINASDQVVGWYANGGSIGHGFLLSDGVYTTLDVPGAVSTFAYGINDSGQIVGFYVDATGQHGFLLDQGSYTTLDVPGAVSTSAYGINTLGQIVGEYSDSAGGHGFLATPKK
jgi:probable HAF family extracellular repeat protein